MSTIADYSILTKAFLASDGVDFSKLYTQEDDGSRKAFAVVPLAHRPHLTTREALNFDTSSWTYGDIKDLISCHDADGKFIGNIVRIQPGVREGSIRLVAKVAVPVTSGDVADASYNTFVLLRAGSPTNVGADFSTNVDLPIAVATISKGYTLHKHLASEIDPLDDVENATYVSFTINNLNGYTSVDFNPDAYATYDDVANALSRGIDGLHIAFDNASGDLKLLDKDGNVLDQANLPIKADVIIADGEEGYKYVKTDVKQDIHAAKAWMPKGSTAWESVPAAEYTVQHAALVVGKGSSRVFVSSKPELSCPISTNPVEISYVEINNSIYMLGGLRESPDTLFKVKGNAETPQYQVTLSEGQVTITDEGTPEPGPYDVKSGTVEVDVITIDGTLYVLGETKNIGESRYRALPTGSGVDKYVYGHIETREDASTGGVVGITLDKQSMYTFEEGATTSDFKDHSGGTVTWFGTKPIPAGYTFKYGLEAFVWTVKDAEAGKKIIDPFFQQLNASLLDLGFHEGDDIALGTHIGALSEDLNGVDADEYIHGKDNKELREKEVDAQRANAKEELVAWNAQHPKLTENRQDGTIIDSSGLDVRAGRITLGCGRTGEANTFQKVNYGIQMKDRSLDPIRNRSESLDFTVSHNTGVVQFDGNGHAVKAYAEGKATNLDSSTLLSIEAGSYISGAPTCLILAEVTHNSESDPVMFDPVRMTAGFNVTKDYTSSGLSLTIHDYRDNIKAILNPDGNNEMAPSIIEVQAIYTHRNAETIPAQQMHTYIGDWDYSQNQDHPTCSFLCNKIEEWMTAVGLTDTDTSTAEGVKLYVVIRVY